MNQISLKSAAKQTGSVFIRNIGKIFVFALLVYLPIALIQILFFDTDAMQDFYTALSQMEAGAEAQAKVLSAYGDKILIYFGGMIIISLFSLLYTAAISRTALCQITGAKTDGLSLFDSAIRLFPKMLLTMLLYFLFIAAGLILCFIPGVLFAIVFSQAPYLVALTDNWKMQALRLSEKLVRRHTVLFVVLLLLNLAFGWLNDLIFSGITTGLLSVTGLTGIAADAVSIVFYILQYAADAFRLIFCTVVLLQVIRQNADLKINLTKEVGKSAG